MYRCIVMYRWCIAKRYINAVTRCEGKWYIKNAMYRWCIAAIHQQKRYIKSVMYRPQNGHFSGWSMHEHHQVAPPERLDSGFYPVGASYALLPSIAVLMLPLWRLMNAENGCYLVLSTRYISDTSIRIYFKGIPTLYIENLMYRADTSAIHYAYI